MGFARTLSYLVTKKNNNGGILEVNFDTHPSPLMTAIVECDWETVVKISRESPTQAETWHHRFQEPGLHNGAPNKGTLIWRLLPIHAALTYMAPLEAVMAVLSAYPTGIRIPDDKGRLPIHLAFKLDAEDEVVSSLVEEYPEGFQVRDDSQRTPLDYIAESSERNWIEDMEDELFSLREDRIESEIITLEETLAELKLTIRDYETILTKSSEPIEMDYDELQGTVRITEKFRLPSPRVSIK